MVEQDPVEIEQAAIKAIAGAVEKSGVSETDILCVGISSAMHSLICLNDQHEPISPSITWADGRSVEQANRLKASFGNDLYLKTGTPIHPMSPLTKLIWMKETNYELTTKRQSSFLLKSFCCKSGSVNLSLIMRLPQQVDYLISIHSNGRKKRFKLLEFQRNSCQSLCHQQLFAKGSHLNLPSNSVCQKIFHL